MKRLLPFFFLLPSLALPAPETPPLTPTFGQETSVPHPVSPFDTARGSTKDPFVAAQDEAAHWLALLDQQQYGPSWLDSGSFLKDVVTQNQWIGAMQATRKPFGNVLSRSLTKNSSITQLPNGTKGNFIVIHYRTLFSRNVQAEEVIVLMTNQMGQWRVVSYLTK